MRNLLSRLADDIGANRVVLALSVARLGDAMGNSILFIIIPLYVAHLPAPSFPIPESVRVGILISLYGLVNSAIQPLRDESQRPTTSSATGFQRRLRLTNPS